MGNKKSKPVIDLKNKPINYEEQKELIKEGVQKTLEENTEED